MKILIKQAKIISSGSPYHLQVKDIAVINGIIKAIDDSINGDFETIIEGEGNCVSVGWMDIFADFADPGYEHNETLESGTAGGGGRWFYRCNADAKYKSAYAHPKHK